MDKLSVATPRQVDLAHEHVPRIPLARIVITVRPPLLVSLTRVAI